MSAPNCKILVHWTEGRFKGSTSLVKRSNVKEENLATGELVKVVWGKSKKMYEAVVLITN